MKNEIMEDFLKPLYDDLNTPRALAVLNGWFDKLKKNDFPDDLLIQLINKALNILGFDLKKENISETIVDENKEKEIIKMITERQIARQRKDFKKADEIREKLKKMDILIDDTSEGTKWTVHEK